MCSCKFTAAACGMDDTDRSWARDPWSSEGERGLIREVSHQEVGTTKTINTSTCVTSRDKKFYCFYSLSIIQPFLETTSFLLFSLLPPPPSSSVPLQVDKLVGDELFESLQVLSVELHVVVSGPLHPERLHGALTALIQRQAVGEVDDLVLCAVDHQHRWCYLGNLVDALKWEQKGKRLIKIQTWWQTKKTRTDLNCS